MLKLKKCNEVMLPKSLIDGYLVHHRQLLRVWRMENGRHPWGWPQALVLVLPSATSARVPRSEPTAPASECPSSEPTSLSDVCDSSAPLWSISLLWGQRAKLSPMTFLSLSSTVFGCGHSLSFPRPAGPRERSRVSSQRQTLLSFLKFMFLEYSWFLMW